MKSVDELWADMQSEETTTRKDRDKKLKSLNLKNGRSKTVDRILQSKTRNSNNHTEGKDGVNSKKKAGDTTKPKKAIQSSFAAISTVTSPSAPIDDIVASLTAVTATPASDLQLQQSLSELEHDLLRRSARDINCITDENITVRRKALSTLHANVTALALALSPDADPSPAPVFGSLLDAMAKPLFKRFDDPGEGCRELSLKLVSMLISRSPMFDVARHLGYLFPALLVRGVPGGAAYDAESNLFVHDPEEHAAYRRGVATERQDKASLLSSSVVEPSEEIRLLLAKLVGKIVETAVQAGAASTLRPYFDDIMLLLACQLRDPFPDLKVEACQQLERLSDQTNDSGMSPFEAGMKFYAVGIARAILPLLRHRHAKVRCAAMKALHKVVMVPDRAKCKGAGTGAIVDLVGFTEDNVISVAQFYGRGGTVVNHAAELCWDPNVTVRMATAHAFGDWISILPDRYDHQPRILPYVLCFLTDSDENVANCAALALCICGKETESEKGIEELERKQYGVDGDKRNNTKKPLPAPWGSKGRPPRGERLFVRNHMRRFLKPLMMELTNWVSHTRVRSALLLRTIIVFCEESLTMEANHMIVSLQKALTLAIREKDEPLQTLLLQSAELVGRYVPPEAYLPVLLPRLRGEAEVSPTGTDSNTRSTVLKVLGSLIDGTLPSAFLPHLNECVCAVSECVRNAGSMQEGLDALYALKSVLTTVTTAGGGAAVVEAHFNATGRLSTLDKICKGAVGAALIWRRGHKGIGSSSNTINSSTSQSVTTIAEDCLTLLGKLRGGCSAEHAVTAHASQLAEESVSSYPVGSACAHTSVEHCTLVELVGGGWSSVRDACAGQICGILSIAQASLTSCTSAGSPFEVSAFASCELLLIAISYPVPDKVKLAIIPLYRKLQEFATLQQWNVTPRLKHLRLLFVMELLKCETTCVNEEEKEAWVPIINVALQYIEDIRSPADVRVSGLNACNQILERCIPTSSVSSFRMNRLRHVSSAQPLSENMTSAARFTFSALRARLADASDAVRHRAVEVLGTLLFFVREEHSAENATSVPGESNFSDGHVCEHMHVLNVSTLMDTLLPLLEQDIVLKDEVDGLLRQIACLDPHIFLSIVSKRRAEFTGSSALEFRELLSELEDHAELLITLGGGINKSCESDKNISNVVDCVSVQNEFSSKVDGLGDELSAELE